MLTRVGKGGGGVVDLGEVEVGISALQSDWQQLASFKGG